MLLIRSSSCSALFSLCYSSVIPSNPPASVFRNQLVQAVEEQAKTSSQTKHQVVDENGDTLSQEIEKDQRDEGEGLAKKDHNSFFGQRQRHQQLLMKAYKNMNKIQANLEKIKAFKNSKRGKMEQMKKLLKLCKQVEDSTSKSREFKIQLKESKDILQWISPLLSKWRWRSSYDPINEAFNTQLEEEQAKVKREPFDSLVRQEDRAKNLRMAERQRRETLIKMKLVQCLASKHLNKHLSSGVTRTSDKEKSNYIRFGK